VAGAPPSRLMSFDDGLDGGWDISQFKCSFLGLGGGTWMGPRLVWITTVSLSSVGAKWNSAVTSPAVTRASTDTARTRIHGGVFER
jgi:hypothetical protein